MLPRHICRVLGKGSRKLLQVQVEVLYSSQVYAVQYIELGEGLQETVTSAS